MASSINRKARRNARQKIYYQNNKEARKLYAANYRIAHRLELVERGRVDRARAKLKRPWGRLFYHAKKRAEKKSLVFSLTEEWAKVRWTGYCELSGLPFDLTQTRRSGVRMRSPSLDRIRPELGYIAGNCRFILFALNALKGDGTDAQMYEAAQALLTQAIPNQKAA